MKQGFHSGMGESEMNRTAESVSIIGGADGPASVFIAGEADHCQFPILHYRPDLLGDLGGFKAA